MGPSGRFGIIHTDQYEWILYNTVKFQLRRNYSRISSTNSATLSDSPDFRYVSSMQHQDSNWRITFFFHSFWFTCFCVGVKLFV